MRPRARAAAPRDSAPGTARSSRACSSCGTLATHTVVTAPQVVRMPDGIPLSRACLLGCGVSTGRRRRVADREGLAGRHRGGDRARRDRPRRAPGRTDRGRRTPDRGRRRPRQAGVGRRVRRDRRRGRIERRPGRRGARADRRGGRRRRVRGRRAARPACVRRSRCWRSPAPRSRSACRPLPSEVTLPWNGSDRAAYPTQGEPPDHRRRRPDPRRRLPRDGGAGTSTGRSTSTGWSRARSALTEDDLVEAVRAMLAGEVIRTVVVLDAETAG